VINLHGRGRWVLEQWYLIETGRNKIFNRVYGFVPEVVMIFTYLEVKGLGVSPWWIVVAVISLLTAFYITGTVYDKLNLNHIESEVHNDRNPTIRKLDLILEKLEKLEKVKKNG